MLSHEPRHFAPIDFTTVLPVEGLEHKTDMTAAPARSDNPQERIVAQLDRLTIATKLDLTTESRAARANMMESPDMVAGGGGAHHRVLDTDARMQLSQAPLERTALPAIAALMDSTARRLLRNGTAPPPPMASAQVKARAVERTVTTAVEDGRAAGHAITADGVAAIVTPSMPTRRKRGRPRGWKNKPKPTTDANQPKRRRTAATPQRSVDNVMNQVSTPRVPEHVVEGPNAARRSQHAGPLVVSQHSGIHVTTTLAASVGVLASADVAWEST
ncbi:unnamed protein product [Phytophthora fragariaefolia]|uniref:Unnamed protein product n=1 Tax=Phytophthora fragariaefolia TaxID=1490495 RepID=A0A9W6XFA8_9STRA|nr:unnamed protein product [Phytophthora fragariaefolia]